MKFFKKIFIIFGLTLIMHNYLAATMTFVNLTDQAIPISIACDHSKNFPNDWTGNTPSWYIIPDKTDKRNQISFPCSEGISSGGRPLSAWSTIMFGLIRLENGIPKISVQKSFIIDDKGASTWYIHPNGCVYWQIKDPPNNTPCNQRWK